MFEDRGQHCICLCVCLCWTLVDLQVNHYVTAASCPSAPLPGLSPDPGVRAASSSSDWIRTDAPDFDCLLTQFGASSVHCHDLDVCRLLV